MAKYTIRASDSIPQTAVACDNLLLVCKGEWRSNGNAVGMEGATFMEMKASTSPPSTRLSPASVFQPRMPNAACGPEGAERSPIWGYCRVAGVGCRLSLLSLPRAAVIGLQWFAAEDEGRTEEPTETKIRKAREEEGRVAKSQDLVAAIGLLIPALAILFLAPYLLRNCMDMVRFFFLRAAELDPGKDRIVFGVFLSYFARLALPLLGIALAAALFSNIIQVGFVFTTKPLGFKFERIVPNFGAYFQKTLFSANSLFNFFKSIAKMAIVGGVAFFLIRSDIEKLVNLQTAALYLSVTTVASLAIRLLIFTALLLLVLSIPDYMFQRSQFRESLKMSRQEIIEERKQDEGDPRIKQRLRRRMQELLAVKIREELPKADVVITNPTHFAVGLQYNRELEGPRVIVKGEDELALRIRRLAAEFDVPVVENKPLARALYAEVEIGGYVPVKYWAVIAEILKRVKTMDEYRRLAGL